MMGFLKSFLSGEKSTEEKALLAEKKHDVLTLDAYAIEDEMDEEEESCAPTGGCCGGGCR